MTHEELQTVAKARTGISRRSIAKGAAWTVPVVAIGAAAPTASASTQPPAADALYIAGRVSATVGATMTYHVYGEHDGDLGGEYPDGTTLTFPAGWVVEGVTAGGGTVTQNPDGTTTVTFPAGVDGAVRGHWTETGSKTVHAEGPGVLPGSITTTVS